MNKLQKLGAAITLVLLLSVPIAAGDIHTGIVSPPPPPPMSGLRTNADAMDKAQTAESLETDSLVTEITLSLLQLLALY